MNKIKFAHLHTHSHFSLLDGMSTEDEIIQKAKEIKVDAIAITDHGNLYSLPFFYNKAKENGINPIIGVEFYYAPKDWRTNENYHLLVLAVNDIGVKNIYKLLTISTDQFYYKPKITKKDLFSHSKGLIVTTGCIASHFNSLILKNKLDEVEKELKEFYEVFGSRLLIEIQDHGLQSQEAINKFWFEINKKYKLKMIATNDSHYTNKEDAEYHDYMLAIQTGKKIHDTNRLRFTDDKNNLLKEFYIKSPEEMLEKRVFRENPELLKNAYDIAQVCEYDDVRFDAKLKMPEFDTKGQSIEDYFKKMVYEKAKEVLKEKYEEYLDRLKYEIDNIIKLGFAGYFLIVHNIVQAAKNMNILVGPGRGSAAGSLVCYVLRITSIDPVKYGLLFDRFINPERVTPPDIDIDFEDEQRDRVISYIREKFGKENTANIITFVRMGDKMAVRDVCRSLGIEAQEINRFADALGDNDINDDSIFNIPHLKKFFEQDARFKESILIARKLEGRVRQTSVHASGIVVSKYKLHEILPLSVVVSGDEKTKVTSYDMAGIEMVGLLKVDVLGLRSLNLIKNVIKSANININIYNLETNDQNVYKNIFSTGKTTGVFQFESEGMRNYLKMLKPDKIEDLIAMNALYRPGPMKFVENYIRRKHGAESYSVYDDRLNDVLSETYGIMVYQEQIMKIFQRITNSSLAKADLMRRAIGKKKKEIIDQMRQEFIESGMKNGYSKDLLERIYSDIESFADYGFNKSHAAAYSYLAYVMAYLKNYYTLDYFVELANSHEGDLEKVAFCLQKAKEEHGIDTILPSIRHSRGRHTKSNGKILFGLYHIRGVKKSAIDEIIEYNKTNPISSFPALIRFFEQSEHCDIKTIEGLFWAGAFMFDREYRSEKNFQEIKSLYESKKKSKKVVKTATLFDFTDDNANNIDMIKINLDYENINKKEIFDKEVHYIGMPISFPIFVDVNFKFRDIVKLDNNKFVGNIVGFVYEYKKNLTKNGKIYYNITIIDSAMNKKYGVYFGGNVSLEFLDLCLFNVNYEIKNGKPNMYFNSIEKKSTEEIKTIIKNLTKYNETNSTKTENEQYYVSEKTNNKTVVEEAHKNSKNELDTLISEASYKIPRLPEKDYKKDKTLKVYLVDREDIREEDLDVLNLYLNSNFFISDITNDEDTISKVFDMIVSMIEFDNPNIDFFIHKASLLILCSPKHKDFRSMFAKLYQKIQKYREFVSKSFF